MSIIIISEWINSFIIYRTGKRSCYIKLALQYLRIYKFITQIIIDLQERQVVLNISRLDFHCSSVEENKFSVMWEIYNVMEMLKKISINESNVIIIILRNTW